jgi:hypothetical protein
MPMEPSAWNRVVSSRALYFAVFVLEIVSIKTRNYIAGAIPTLDTEPLDGVSYANGVFGYITLVRLLNHARYT